MKLELQQIFNLVNTSRDEYNEALEFFEHNIRKYFDFQVNNMFAFIDKDSDLIFWHNETHYSININRFEEFMQDRNTSEKISIKELEPLLYE